jgi:hypothetical protein
VIDPSPEGRDHARIASGRYHDRFERREARWRFAERRVRVDLVGDVSRHLRRAKPASAGPG